MIADAHCEVRGASAACDARSIAWCPPLHLWGRLGARRGGNSARRRGNVQQSVASADVRDGRSAGGAFNPVVALSTPIRAHGEVAMRVAANDAARDASAAPGLLRIGLCDARDWKFPNWLARDRAELGGSASGARNRSEAIDPALQLLPAAPRWFYESGGRVTDAGRSPSCRVISVAQPREQDLAVGTVVRFVFDAERRSATVWLTTRGGGGDDSGGGGAPRAASTAGANAAGDVRAIVALPSPQRGGADDTLIATLADLPQHVRLFSVLHSAEQEVRFIDVLPCAAAQVAARLRVAQSAAGGWACGGVMDAVGVSIAPSSSPSCRILSYRTTRQSNATSVGTRLTAPITLQPGERRIVYIRWNMLKRRVLPEGAAVVTPSEMCIGVCTAKFNARAYAEGGGGWVCRCGSDTQQTFKSTTRRLRSKPSRLGDDAGGESVALVSSGALTWKGQTKGVARMGFRATQVLRVELVRGRRGLRGILGGGFGACFKTKTTVVTFRANYSHTICLAPSHNPLLPHRRRRDSIERDDEAHDREA